MIGGLSIAEMKIVYDRLFPPMTRKDMKEWCERGCPELDEPGPDMSQRFWDAVAFVEKVRDFGFSVDLALKVWCTSES